MKLLINIIMFLGVLGLSLFGSHAYGKEAVLNVMTYNVRYLHSESDPENNWILRKQGVAALMDGKDIVGTQEAKLEQLEDLDDLLPDYSRFGLGRNANLGNEYSAVYYRKDRLVLLDRDTFWLSETPSIPGSKSWDAGIERVVTWGKFRDVKSGDEFYFFNTHFDHEGVTARLRSSELILSKMEEIAGENAAILTGDFNFEEQDSPYSVLTGMNGLTDAFKVVDTPIGPTGTFNSFNSGPTNRRIDFIFLSNKMEVESYTVDSTVLPSGEFPSDHFPIITELKINSLGDAYTQLIEAEKYESSLGVRTVASNENGQNLDRIDSNDWVEYRVYIPKAQDYTIGMRVANEGSTGLARLFKNGSPISSSMSIPVTGDSQHWKTIHTVVSLDQGHQTIRFTGESGRWSLNWWTIEAKNDQEIRFNIKNRWRGDNGYLYDSDSSDRVKYSNLTPGNGYEWVIEPLKNGLVEFRNVETNHFMNIENNRGYIQLSEREIHWWSSRWSFEYMSNGFTRVQNYWRPNDYMHNQNNRGYMQYGPLSSDKWSSQWTLINTQ